MATGSGEVPVNGHSKESSASMSGSDIQAPLIDDSVIIDDDEGLPLISAVYSLATDGGSDESTFSGTNIGVLNSSSTTGAPQIINLSKTVSVKTGSLVDSGMLLNSSSVTSNRSDGTTTSAFQSRECLSQTVGNNTLINRTPSETTYSSESTITPGLHERKDSPQMIGATARTVSVMTSTASNLHSSGNMSHLENLVNSVKKVDPPQTVPPLISTATISNKSPPAVTLNKVSVLSQTHFPSRPPAHLPRQIAMKQPLITTGANKQTSIILNLKPGEAIPKALNLLGPDGRSMVVLTLTEGGKQLVTPTGAAHTGAKILIPIPSNLSAPPAPAKKVAFVNKVYPIAPLPVKTTAVSPQAGTSPLIISVSGSAKNPPAVSTMVVPTVPSFSTNVSNFSESRPSVVSPSATGTEPGLSRIGSSSVASTTPTKITPLEPKPSSSTANQSTGLSPQEARIQRLKELIKRQEDAVNKLREKRRLEIERIRDPSLTSAVDDVADTSDLLKSERVPLAEHKRPSSPFAVPLPPKKRIKEYSNLKTNVAKPTDSSVTPSEGAFLPNADDKSFVQLIGLENVVNNIK